MRKEAVTLLNAAAVFTVLLLLWQALVWILHLPPFMLPPPLAVGRAVVDRFPSLFTSLAITSEEAAGGLAASIVVGLLIALLFAVGGFLLWYRGTYNVFPGQSADSRVHWCNRDYDNYAQALSLRTSDFIEAAKVQGLPLRNIVFRQLLPNIGPYVAIHFLLAVTDAVGIVTDPTRAEPDGRGRLPIFDVTAVKA